MQSLCQLMLLFWDFTLRLGLCSTHLMGTIADAATSNLLKEGMCSLSAYVFRHTHVLLPLLPLQRVPHTFLKSRKVRYVSN